MDNVLTLNSGQQTKNKTAEIIDISSDSSLDNSKGKKRERHSTDDEIEYVGEAERKRHQPLLSSIVCIGLLGCYLMELQKNNIDLSKAVNGNIEVKINIRILHSMNFNTLKFAVIDSLDSKLIGYLPDQAANALSPFTKAIKIQSKLSVKDMDHIYVKLLLFAEPFILPSVSLHFNQIGLRLFAPDENIPCKYVNLQSLNDQSQENDQMKLLNQTNSRVEQLYKSFTSPQNLEEMEQDPRLKTKLLKYQKQALNWLYCHEQESKTDDDIVFWKKTGSQWRNMITDTVCTTKPKKVRGGILADDMGLGKTIQMLAVILKNPPKSATNVHSKSNDVSFPGNSETQIKSDASIGRVSSKATLIICPLSTVHNWVEQIKNHVNDDSINILVHHGSSRSTDPVKIASFDIVITTYNLISIGKRYQTS
jgi:SNF2 family DNA or RNA helicase